MVALPITHPRIEFHDVANIFPLIEGKEFDDLVDDIRTNGLQQSIWTYQGKIIDGRNRYRACMAAGVGPHYREWDGKGSLVAFTISLNVKRRHLTSSQLAVVALSVERLLAEETTAKRNAFLKQGDLSPVVENFLQRGKASVEAAQILGTNQHYVTDAKRIERESPTLIKHVLDGTLTVPDAKAILSIPTHRRDAIIEKVVGSREEEGRRASGVIRQAIQEEMGEKTIGDVNTLRVMGSSDSPEWYTPKDVIDRVLSCFGEIDLDPCSNSHEQPSIPARTLYTREDDGLSQSWQGKVYLNPPYGSEIPEWTRKLVSEYEAGNVTEAIALLPGRIDTNWFQPLYAYLMCNVHGRLQFANSPYNSPFPAVIVYLGRQPENFIDAFKEIGPIMRRIG